MLEETEIDRRAPTPASPDAYLHRLETRLPPLLAAIAGMDDIIGYLQFKLFTAHVTGNLVVVFALLVRGGPPNLAQVLSVPVFIGAVALVWTISKLLRRRGTALVRPLLVIQFALLACVLLTSAAAYGGNGGSDGAWATVVPMVAVSAMAAQFSLLRLVIPNAPSTAVMTGNLTNSVLSVLDVISFGQPLTTGATDRLRKASLALIGFSAGCVIGAAAVSTVGDYAWAIPAGLAGIILALT